MSSVRHQTNLSILRNCRSMDRSIRFHFPMDFGPESTWIHLFVQICDSDEPVNMKGGIYIYNIVTKNYLQFSCMLYCKRDLERDHEVFLLLLRLDQPETFCNTQTQLPAMMMTKRSTTSMDAAIRDRFSIALNRILYKSHGNDLVRKSYISVSPPVKSCKASHVEPPFMASYEPHSFAYAFSSRGDQNSSASAECMNSNFPVYDGRRSSMYTSIQDPYCQNYVRNYRISFIYVTYSSCYTLNRNVPL